MGTCKDEMRKTVKDSDKKDTKSIFERFNKLKQADKDETQIAQTTADNIASLVEKLPILIKDKNNDLKTEKGKEDYNRRQKGRLEVMLMLAMMLEDLASEYASDN